MAEITSTRQRLQEFLLKNPDYEVSTEPIYMPALDGWLVRTSVTNFIDGKPRIFQGASFRKIEYNSTFTALETAETVSLGRCLSKMGFGIDQEFATIDEMSGLPITQVETIAKKLEGEKLAIDFWILTSSLTKELARKMGYLDIIQRAGGNMIDSTCIDVPPCWQPYYGKTGITDSPKCAYYNEIRNIKFIIRPLEECVDAAIRGEVLK